MRASKTERTGMVGESEVEAEFRRLGWAAHKTAGGQDNGTDFLVSPRERRWELGFYLGVQVKSGPSAFERPKREGGKVTGWWYIDDEGEELGGWAGYPTQQIVVLHDLESRTSYWEHVRPDAIRPTGKGDKLFVPATQMLDSESEEKLRAVAASFGTRGSLEGTWVEGYPISPPDRLRYALIAPRLLAPHPNFSTKKLTAEQAIAMLTQVRVGELFRYAEEQEKVPRGRKALESRNWTWRFFGAFWCQIFEGEDEPLRRVLDEARKKRERAAVLGCLSAQMIGAARPQDALALLDTELNGDRLGVVDHGWLAAQRARALAELGDTEAAREGARKLMGLRTAAPQDQTAIAISASAAALFANLSEPGVEIATETMKATDVPTGWFRAQTVRNGLREIFERTFEEGMQDDRNKWSREDGAHNRLLAGALEASHAADQVGWANVSGMLGRNEALELERDDDPGVAADAIETLRLAGDVNALKLAVPRLCDDGPCLGVTAALEQIDPGSGTRTTGLAELVLIELGGDLADRRTANRLGRWLLDAIADPAPFEERTSPTYLLDVQLVSSLVGVVGSAGIRVQQRAIQAAIETDKFGEDVLLERIWARLLADIPADAWTPGLADAAFSVAATEEPGVYDQALVACAALAGHADARDRLLDQVRAGDTEALWGLGPYGSLPRDIVSSLLESLADELRQIRRAYRHGGSFLYGADDPVRLFTVLGVWNPDETDWNALFRFLADPAVLDRHKTSALMALIWGAERLPEEPAKRLSRLVNSTIRFRSVPGDGDDRDFLYLSCMVAASLGVLREPDQWLAELLAGDRRHRRFGAKLATKLARAQDIGTLGALLTDSDPHLRALAAAGLTEMLVDATADTRPTIRSLLEVSLEDHGRVVQRAIAVVLGEDELPGPFSTIAEVRLTSHPAASVRTVVPSGSDS
jgi:hypothetical protein